MNTYSPQKKHVNWMTWQTFFPNNIIQHELVNNHPYQHTSLVLLKSYRSSKIYSFKKDDIVCMLLCASFHSNQLIKTGVTARKRLIRAKNSNFFSHWSLEFDGWPWITTGHLSYATPRFLFHLIPHVNYTPRFNEVDGGYTGITLSVCPSVDRIVSALYLQQYSSDPFHICTSYQATSEGVSRVMPVSKFKNLKFWRIFKICNFDFVIFWLGIQYDSMVWVIMRRRGVSSERRRSSCSSSNGSYGP